MHIYRMTLKKYRSPVIVAKHCIFDLQMIRALNDYDDQTVTEDKLIVRTYIVIIPVKLECFLFHLIVSISGGRRENPRMPNDTTHSDRQSRGHKWSRSEPIRNIRYVREARLLFYFNFYRVKNHKLVIDIRWGCCIFTRTLYKYNRNSREE